MKPLYAEAEAEGLTRASRITVTRSRRAESVGSSGVMLASLFPY